MHKSWNLKCLPNRHNLVVKIDSYLKTTFLALQMIETGFLLLPCETERKVFLALHSWHNSFTFRNYQSQREAFNQFLCTKPLDAFSANTFFFSLCLQALVNSQDCGKQLLEVVDLLQKHNLIDLQISSYDDRLTHITQRTAEISKDSTVKAEVLYAKVPMLRQLYQNLIAQSRTRYDSLWLFLSD